MGSADRSLGPIAPVDGRPADAGDRTPPDRRWGAGADAADPNRPSRGATPAGRSRSGQRLIRFNRPVHLRNHEAVRCLRPAAGGAARTAGACLRRAPPFVPFACPTPGRGRGTTRSALQEVFTMPDAPPMKVDCKDCHFSRVVDADDDELPGEVLVRHGRETGHTLRTSRLDRQQDPPSP